MSPNANTPLTKTPSAQRVALGLLYTAALVLLALAICYAKQHTSFLS
jgi:hypothetical protein